MGQISRSNRWAAAATLAGGGLALALPPVAPAAAVIYDPVALRGQPAPGMPPGTVFYDFNQGNRFKQLPLTEAGRVAFYASVLRPDQQLARAVYATPAPGADPVLIDDSPSADRVPMLAINAAGTVVTSGSGDNPPTLNDLGHVALIGADLYAGPPGSEMKVAGVGDPVPGVPGATYGRISGGYFPTNSSAGYAPINDLGQVSYFAAVNDSQGASTNAIFAGPYDQPTLIAREGTPAPGTNGAIFDFVVIRPQTVLNDAGRLAFAANLSKPNVEFYKGLFIADADGTDLDLIAREGQDAPGLPGYEIRHLQEPPMLGLNDAGNVVFRATLQLEGSTTPTGFGIFTGPADDLRALAYAGGPAAPFGPGVTFAEVFEPSLNDDGQIAFTATLAGGDVDGDRVLLLYDPEEGTSVVLRSGEEILLNTGQRVIVDGFEFLAGPGDDLPTGFGRDGTFALDMSVSGGDLGAGNSASGIFYVSVPEPACVTAPLLGAAGLLLRRRRRQNPARE